MCLGLVEFEPTVPGFMGRPTRAFAEGKRSTNNRRILLSHNKIIIALYCRATEGMRPFLNTIVMGTKRKTTYRFDI